MFDDSTDLLDSPAEAFRAGLGLRMRLQDWLASFRAFVQDDFEDEASTEERWQEVGVTLEHPAELNVVEAARPWMESDIES